MADDFQDYLPTKRFAASQTLLSNHFRFNVEALPDVSFFVQSVTLPDVSATTAKMHTPFTTVPQVGDHLEFGNLSVFFQIDAKFKSYFSLFYWLKGYGFPTGYEDIENFTTSRQQKMGNPRPTMREVMTTTATLLLLSPQTDSTIAEVTFIDAFPIMIGPVTLTATEHEPEPLKAQVTFAYTDFNIRLTNPN